MKIIIMDGKKYEVVQSSHRNKNLALGMINIEDEKDVYRLTEITDVKYPSPQGKLIDTSNDMTALINSTPIIEYYPVYKEHGLIKQVIHREPFGVDYPLVEFNLEGIRKITMKEFRQYMKHYDHMK